MTATLSPNDRREALTLRLTELHDERLATLAEITPVGNGDDADRATNVDGHVRLAMVERRIADVEAELADAEYDHRPNTDGTASVGDIVTVDFGDGPEQYLLGSVEETGPGLDVITPGSPLGRAIVGAAAGVTVSYEPRPHRSASATLVSIG
jgi:transcription elongation factor GreA